jgi:hypothetical protein
MKTLRKQRLGLGKEVEKDDLGKTLEGSKVFGE